MIRNYTMKVFSMSLLLAVLFAGCKKKETYFSPGALWFDNKGVHINAHGGGILFDKETYYWFGEHKIEGKKGNTAQVGIHCYSSKNLYDWKDEGIAFSVVNDSNSLIDKGCVIERPKVIYNAKTKQYVMWFHHEIKGMGYKAALTGLATSKKVTGPYQYIKSVNPNKNQWPLNYADSLISKQVDLSQIKKWSAPWRMAVEEGVFLKRDFEKGQMARDMTLFVDTDGVAYHMHASEENATLHISELNEEYTDFTGVYSRVLAAEMNEAPTLFKKGNKYYMISSGCTGWKPNAARSAVANHPLGPWKSLGNPSRGNRDEMATTFASQSTFVLPIQDKKDAFIYMGDRWMPDNAIDGRYIWLPIEFVDDKPTIQWHERWNLSIFNN